MFSRVSCRLRRSDLAMAAVTVGGLIVAVMPAVATAQSINWQVGVASEYIRKGVGSSSGEIAPFGSIEATTGQVYASVMASSAELSAGADAEIVTTIGWRPTVGDVKFDLAVVNRDLPGTRAGLDSNFFEYQADASRAFGPVTARLRVNYTPDGYAAAREALWVELQGTVSLDSKTKASVAIADRSADGAAEYVAWNAGVKRKLTDDLSADLRWYDTDGHSFGKPYEGRLFAALSYAF